MKNKGRKVDWITLKPGETSADLSNLKPEITEEILQEIDKYEGAVETYRALGDRAGEARELVNLGKACFRLGQIDDATVAYDLALAIYKEMDARKEAADVHSRLGKAYLALRDAKKAVENHMASHDLYTQLEDWSGAANALSSLAMLYSFTQQQDLTLKLFKDALAIYRQIGDHSGEASTLNNLGGLALERKQPREALSLFAAALEVAHQNGLQEQEVNCGLNLGFVHSLLDEPDRALDVFQSALALSRSIGDRENEASLLMAIAQVYFKKKDLDHAIELSRQADEIFQSIGGPNAEDAHEQLKSYTGERRRNSPISLVIGVGIPLLLCLGIFAWTSISNSISRSRAQKTTISETQFPTRGSISGRVVDKNGNSLADLSRGETGLVALFCAEPNVEADCLQEGYQDLDASTLLASICHWSDLKSDCLIHYGTGAAEIRVDGRYSFNSVPPGQYKLVIIIYGSGLAMIIQTNDIDPVVAGQVTRFDFMTK